MRHLLLIICPFLFFSCSNVSMDDKIDSLSAHYQELIRYLPIIAYEDCAEMEFNPKHEGEISFDMKVVENVFIFKRVKIDIKNHFTNLSCRDYLTATTEAWNTKLRERIFNYYGVRFGEVSSEKIRGVLKVKSGVIESYEIDKPELFFKNIEIIDRSKFRKEFNSKDSKEYFLTRILRYESGKAFKYFDFQREN